MQFCNGASNLESDLDRLVIKKNDLAVSVSFEKLPDRFSHQIEFSNPERKILLVSEEGSSDQIWPASPALQELHFESRTESDVLLAVGMAGDSHYSLSVESNRVNELRFQFASRFKKQPEFIGSSYKVIQATMGDTATNDPTDINLLENELFEIATSNETELTTEFTDGKTARIQALNLNRPELLPSTLQWGFTLILP